MACMKSFMVADNCHIKKFQVIMNYLYSDLLKCTVVCFPHVQQDHRNEQLPTHVHIVQLISPRSQFKRFPWFSQHALGHFQMHGHWPGLGIMSLYPNLLVCQGKGPSSSLALLWRPLHLSSRGERCETCLVPS